MTQALSREPDAGQARREGRLADPSVELRTEPRLHPGLRAAFAAYGLDGHAAPPPLDRGADPGAVAEFVGACHTAFEGLYAAMPAGWPGEAPADVTYRTETTQGADGNDIALHIFRPAGASGPLPGVIYLHGGGMTILDTANKVHQQWSRDLAAAGLTVVAVDFRNAWTPGGLNPFPAGLDDCAAGIDWVHAHRGELGISKVILQGESGGANLVLASALKAKREDRLDRIDGVYAMVPYISGGYGWETSRKLAELPSMVENDGHYLNVQMMDLLVAVYDPAGANAENPLAWPASDISCFAWSMLTLRCGTEVSVCGNTGANGESLPRSDFPWNRPWTIFVRSRVSAIAWRTRLSVNGALSVRIESSRWFDERIAMMW